MLMDGHTHTELCPHGSGEPLEKMILRAIHMGLKKYCITEHAPLPPDFKNSYQGSKSGIDEASISFDDLPRYFALTEKMQKKYGDEIDITIGFEVDYLEGFEDFTKTFLDEYGPRTQENILSVHFMKGTNNKFWCVDNGVEDFENGFESYIKNPQKIFKLYYQTIQKSVEADLGKYAPQRIGHMSLVRKYQDYFNLTEDLDDNNLKLVNDILSKIKRQDRQLDLNLAGLYKPLCNDFYPGKQILNLAQKLSIPLVYGSDAHDIESVGRGIHLLKTLINY
ncbi:histidinol-phosphatase HisJ [Companilactobacillus halodurans]|uniref:Histidinol-phosphatase n=1 Tax=Companilactobacillus halodurans TaxID=2584183 RepID=A0A5P0ZTW8_9LACO|nr:histidinol-phosphatase HisJ [Companilactobacillus halodurans]MQS76067.1 histidinol-phosphatase HisJ [Companilactobacillus halodurans]MQS96503.1 histidinol-phosphatase HisJ [Companilactobacillus halodurans]